eukprot:m.228426 g.228426  ORF g.228426 m.228426 type:complete len:867 (+) comp11740_c0_seq1:45-2645(+)
MHRTSSLTGHLAPTYTRSAPLGRGGLLGLLRVVLLLVALDRHRHGLPDLAGILLDRAIAREEAAGRDVEDALAGPALLVAELVADAVLHRDVRREVRQQAEPVAVDQQRVDEVVEAVRRVGREVAVADLVEDLLELGVALVVLDGIVAALLERLDLLDGHAEDEDVVLADLLQHLDVRTVESADSQGTVDHELHVAGARGLGAGRADLLREIRGGDDLLGQGHAVVLEEDDLEPAAHIGVGVDDVGDGCDQLDDHLGHVVPGRGLAANQDSAGHEVAAGVLLHAVVEGDDVQDVEQLALVLVQALDLDVEERVRVDLDAVLLGQVLGKLLLVDQLCIDDVGKELGVVSQRAQRGKLVQVLDPRLANALGDERGEGHVALQQPAARRDAVGLILELLGPQLEEVLERGVLKNLGVQAGDAVDGVAADDREVRHVDGLLAVLVDQRHAVAALDVAREDRDDVVKMAAIDLVDDHQVARQHALQQRHRPALEGLGQDGVVGVREGLAADVPGLGPRQALQVDQDAHELRNGQRGVRVVELDRALARELLEGGALVLAVRGASAEVLVAADDVLQRRRHEEVLLLEAQLLALEDVVVGVEYTRDVLSQIAVDDGLDVVAVVEVRQIEAIRRTGRPQTHGVDGVIAVAGDGGVVRQGQHDLRAGPLKLAAGEPLDVAVEVDRQDVLRARDLPGIAVLEPVVGGLLLVTIADALLEDTILVADAVPVRGQRQRGHRVEEARSKATKTAVAEAGIDLNLLELLHLQAHLVESLGAQTTDAQVDHGIGERAAHVELQREVVHALRIVAVVHLLSLKPARHDVISHCVREREVVVALRGDTQLLRKGAVQVAVEEAADGKHVVLGELLEPSHVVE